MRRVAAPESPTVRGDWHDVCVIEPTPSSPDPDSGSDPWRRPFGKSGQSGQPEQFGQPGQPGSSGPVHPFDPWSHRRQDGEQGPGTRREVLAAVLWTLGLAVLGVGLGLLWQWLAPRVPLFSDGKAVLLKDPEGEEAIGADGTFVLLALAFGAVSGLLVFARDRSGGIGRLIGLTVGALAGSVVAWRFGVWLGPTTDVVDAAKAAGAGKTFDGPLKLQSLQALLVWPFVGLLVHAVLLWLFGRREAPDGPYDPLHAAPHGG